ncbi:hypothetical protein [Priestia megaterium]|uniref:hypothetical protein n=1 Tax=Priestia megaterium TaxID=1404 RepID=UPI000A50109E|nr:hypothetical protein [Priestia megaterium]
MEVVDEIIVRKEVLSRWPAILEEIVTGYLEKKQLNIIIPPDKLMRSGFLDIKKTLDQ